MSFQNPWLLALIPVFFWLFRRKNPRTSVTVDAIAVAPNLEPGRARYLWLTVYLRQLSVLAVLVALAGPRAPASFDREVNEGIAIQLLVDVSSSMDMNTKSATGQKVSRMELAKEIVEKFVTGDGDTLAGRPHDLIGLITFARYADTRSPLTFGHEALLQIVRNLEIQERPNEDGTAYGDALAIAAARLKNLEELKHRKDLVDLDAIKSRVIILLTDGENNSGAHLPIESAGLAKAWGCRIYSISFGESFQVINEASIIETLTPSEKILEHISQETGGLFRKAYGYESLRLVYEEIDQLERTEITLRQAEHLASFTWLSAAIALTALTLCLILEATWLRVAP
jgi:Ca-activated chloride channel family protein